jgi:hypothetical protein
MKPWYQSKTIIFNLAATVAAFAVTAIEPLRALMSPTAYLIASTAVGLANVALRFITSQPLTTDKE